METLEAKVLAIVALGLGSFIFGLIPLGLRNRYRWPMLMSSLLCLGAGVLLATSLIHILPETKLMLPEYAEIVFCAGFFVLYVVDEVVHFCYGELPSHNHHNHSNGGGGGASGSRFKNYSSIESRPLLSSSCHHQKDGNIPRVRLNSSTSDIRDSSVASHQHDNSDDERAPSQMCHVEHREPCHESPVGHIGLISALCVHSLLEGLAVGVEDTGAKVLLLLAAISCHKLVVGFCLGVELIESGTISLLKYLMSIASFSLGSAGGIALGIIVGKWPSINPSILPSLQGLAGGTLLFVTVCEVLPRERARWHQEHKHRIAGIVQLLSVLFGFIGMTLMTKYLGNYSVNARR